jgi:hypothetical protein
MKLVKSLLLGSVAGLAAVAGAQAADLPVAKAAPVDYVRVCSTYGSGFFYIPGTETCLRVGGRVRADYLYGEPFARVQDAIGFRARGRINIDTRTATAYGLLRAYIRYEITRSSGTPFNGVNGSIGTSPDIAQAFVQFGGLTAGRVTSFFSNGDLPTDHMGTLRFDDAPDVNVLAYTFSFGNGFSATVALEDGLDRRSSGFGIDSPFALAYAGQRVPDVVGNVKYDGTWGTAQLSGAVHQIRSLNLVTPLGATIADYPDTEYGFAISAQVGVNLPMLAEGDSAWVAATYTDGANAYITGGSSDSLATGTDELFLADAVVNPVTGDLSKARAWSVAGGLRHYWTPNLRQNVFGSYARFEYSAVAANVGLFDFNEWRLGTNLIWSPVSGLDIGAEVIWAQLDPRNALVLPAGPGFSDSGWEGRLRIQRDF